MSFGPTTRSPAGALLILLLGLVACGGDAEDGGSRQNVLLVSFDTTRADVLGCYGSNRGATQNIDRLAEDSVRFVTAFSPVPITLPAHTTMLTGLDPPRHQVRDNALYEVPQEAVTLAELLGGEGYRTFAVVASVVLMPKFGLVQGFGTYDTGAMRLQRGAPTERTCDEIATTAIGLLDGSEPFFGFVHFYDPHQPYAPPPEFAARFPRDPYLGEIAAADEALGRILDHLRRSDLLDDTLVIFTSDHGESLGEHGELTHTLLLYDATLRVPLLLSHPSLPSGAVEGPLVTLADLMPTVLDFLGQPVPPGLDGRSLLPVIRGEDTSPGVAYLETLSPQLAYDWAPLFGVRTPEWKLVIGARPHLFHMLEDPRELRDRSTERPDVVEALERQIFYLRDERGPALGGAPLIVSGQERAILGGIGYVTLVAEDPDFDASDLPDPHDHVQAGVELSRARAALDAENYDDAIEILEEQVRLLPGTFLMRQGLGSAYALAGRPRDALQEFLAAAALHADPVDIHLQIAAVAERCGMPELVRSHLQLATEKAGCPPSTFLKLATLLRDSNWADGANDVLKRLLEREVEERWKPEVYRALGQAFTALGDSASASKVVRRMLRRDHIPESVKQQVRGSERRTDGK